MKSTDTARLYAAQRRDATKRDGPKCRMEKWSKGRGQWEECGVKASQTTHIYTRPALGGVKGCAAHVDVVLRTCVRCHDRLDGRMRDGVAVRVPPDREAVAYARACATISTYTVPRRIPPDSPEAA